VPESKLSKPKKNHPTKVPVAAVVEAVRRAQGHVSLAAHMLGLDFSTVYKMAKRVPSVAQAIREEREKMLDVAEAQVYRKVKEGDNTMTIFFLKTQGKHRGWVERQEVTGADGGPLTVAALVKAVLSDDGAQAGATESVAPYSLEPVTEVGSDGRNP
jgi:hypothetical protein